MKNLLKALVFSSALISTSFAETLYINGKPVDQKIIDQTLNQFKKASPMAAERLNDPKFKVQILQSIGMQQAILLEGNSQGLEQSSQYQQKLQEVKPMMYAQIFQDKLTQNPVNDSQLKAKYEQMKQTAMNAKQYKVSHILVKDEKSANNVLAQLKKGQKFAALAKKFSTDPGSKNNGGDLGWSDGSNYVPEFSAAIKTLQKGQYTTAAVKTQFGYHIIQLNDTKTGSSDFASFDKMKDQLKQQAEMDQVKNFFENLKTKYNVVIK
ncbi:MAG TPA: peptidylprolyl isomerase [Burkholderiales bacterium]|nr:peptidylprolyl isomerase [Burkholderiales bacterium]